MANRDQCEEKWRMNKSKEKMPGPILCRLGRGRVEWPIGGCAAHHVIHFFSSWSTSPSSMPKEASVEIALAAAQAAQVGSSSTAAVAPAVDAPAPSSCICRAGEAIRGRDSESERGCATSASEGGAEEGSSLVGSGLGEEEEAPCGLRRGRNGGFICVRPPPTTGLLEHAARTRRHGRGSLAPTRRGPRPLGGADSALALETPRGG